LTRQQGKKETNFVNRYIDTITKHQKLNMISLG